jgi:peptidylprolyl isomerase
MPKPFLALLLLVLALPLFAADAPAPPPDLTSPPADAEKEENGLVTRRLAEGMGTVKPGERDIVRLRYTVWKADGTLVQHVAAPRVAALNMQKLVPGWRAAVAMMVVGEKRRAWVPPALNGGKLPEALVFDTELLEILPYPETPADVAAAPADATVTESGLAYKVLRKGTGAERPTRRDAVKVHYTGWTTGGNLIDSSVLRGTPTEFGLGDVIRGWTEGVQLMVVGEKTRFWIPAKLAYAGIEGKPQGMLVFDIELIEIKKH